MIKNVCILILTVICFACSQANKESISEKPKYTASISNINTGNLSNLSSSANQRSELIDRKVDGMVFSQITVQCIDIIANNPEGNGPLNNEGEARWYPNSKLSIYDGMNVGGYDNFDSLHPENVDYGIYLQTQEDLDLTPFFQNNRWFTGPQEYYYNEAKYFEVDFIMLRINFLGFVHNGVYYGAGNNTGEENIPWVLGDLPPEEKPSLNPVFPAVQLRGCYESVVLLVRNDIFYSSEPSSKNSVPGTVIEFNPNGTIKNYVEGGDLSLELRAYIEDMTTNGYTNNEEVHADQRVWIVYPFNSFKFAMSKAPVSANEDLNDNIYGSVDLKFNFNFYNVVNDISWQIYERDGTFLGIFDTNQDGMLGTVDEFGVEDLDLRGKIPLRDINPYGLSVSIIPY